MPSAKFEKKATFELLADTIEAQIRQEGWKGLLPSGRDLAQQHKVSLPTVQKAIALLIKRKVLVSRGGERRVGVVAASPHQRAGGRCELLVLSAKPLSFYDSTIAMGMLQLADELKARGDGYRFVDLSEKTGVARRKAAHAEMVRTRPTHCVLMSPDSYLYQGVARHPVRIATMFGNLRSKKVQRLGVQYGPLVEIAVGHLKALGHRRFFIPFLGRKVRLKVSLANIARVAKEQGVELAIEYSAEVPTTERIEASLDKAPPASAPAAIPTPSVRIPVVQGVVSWVGEGARTEQGDGGLGSLKLVDNLSVTVQGGNGVINYEGGSFSIGEGTVVRKSSAP